MQSPHRDDLPSAPATRSGDGDGDVLTYVEPSDKGTWEDRQRSRSIPHSFELLCGAFSIFMLWLSTLGTVVSLVMHFTGHGSPWVMLSIGSLAVMVVTLISSLSLSLTKKCPLCHGTPLHSRHCPKHRLAEHWPPFTRRATVVLRILTSLSFRCMYCGTPFRLFKKSSRRSAE